MSTGGGGTDDRGVHPTCELPNPADYPPPPVTSLVEAAARRPDRRRGLSAEEPVDFAIGTPPRAWRLFGRGIVTQFSDPRRRAAAGGTGEVSIGHGRTGSSTEGSVEFTSFERVHVGRGEEEGCVALSASEPVLRPEFGNVQAHYDLSDEFFDLFLDPTRTYSCAYFVEDGMSLQDAQLAKIDLSLAKLNLRPGMTLLDVGCGWGSTMMRAVEKYDVNVIGLTLSRNQATHVQRLIAASPSPRSQRVLLAGWEQFDEPVDRIVSIGAFEHFSKERYPDFFTTAHRLLPADAVMLLHTIAFVHPHQVREMGLPLDRELFAFIRFLMAEIFPGGQLPSVPMVHDHATTGGFTVGRVHSLQPHYATTLQRWASALQSRHADAVAIQSEQIYQRYMRYLTGCADLFRQGYVDVAQFTLEK